VVARRFEEIERADDVGVDERRRGLNRTVDMGLRREVDDRMRRKIGEQAFDRVAVANVGMHEAVAWIAGNISQRLEVSGVCQLVEIAHLMVGLADQQSTHRRSNEAGATRHNNAHHSCPDSEVRPVSQRLRIRT
jgi:hypothetical protein